MPAPNTPAQPVLRLTEDELHTLVANELWGLQRRFAHGGDLPHELVKDVAATVVRKARAVSDKAAA